MKLTELSRLLSYALRHRPWEFELEPDQFGWVFIPQVLELVQRVKGINSFSQADLISLINHFDKKRFEIKEDKIRASYGHSIPILVDLPIKRPPSFLFHGTSLYFLDSILKNGIKAMTRQYVHLSPNQEIAREVAQRKGKEVKILKIDARKAEKEGCHFYNPNIYVWLTSFVDTKYIFSLND
jgi:putative RNA 2'-phosphotransferase